MAERPSARRAPAWLGRPVEFEVEAGDGIAAGDDPAIGTGGFGDQDVAVAGCLSLDQVPGGGAADFLVAGEKEGHGEAGRDAGAKELAHGVEGDEVAAFHVADAGAPGAIALLAEGKFGEGANRVDRVEMAEHQDAGIALARVGEAGADAAGEAHAAGDRFDLGSGNCEVAGGEVQHAADGGGVPGGAFALDPGAEAGEHRVRVKGQVGGVHGGLVSGI